MEIFKSILPVLFFITINGAVSVLLKKGFGKCLPLTLISSVFIVFLSQLLFKTFSVGIYSLIALFVISVYFVIKNKENKQYIFTNGFYVFICLCLVFLIIDFGRLFFWDDEISFWGKMVKEMFRLDKFYYVDESVLRSHKDYPPFMSLFELLWCKLALGYSECNCTYALHIYEFSLLLPNIFDSYFNERKIKEKLLLDILFTLSFIGIVVYLDASDVFNTIYIDTPIALQFAFSVYLIYSKEIENTFGLINYCLAMSMMVMTKQVGIAFSLLSIFYYFINNIKKLKDKYIFIGFVTSIIMPIIFYLLWNKMISPYYILKQFDFNKISYAGLLDIFKNGGYQLETIKLYVNALFKNSIYNTPFPITFLSAFIFEILILELIKSKLNEKNKVTKFEFVCFAGFAGYTLLMFVLYVFCYPEREAIKLICYDRYMSSFISALIVSIVLIFIDINKEAINDICIKKVFISLLIIYAVFDGSKLLDFMPQVILGNRYESIRKLSQTIDKQVEPGSHVFVVYNHDSKDSYTSFLTYFTDTTYYAKNNLDLCADDYSEASKFNATINELKQYDYIYVIDFTDSFVNYFSVINDDVFKPMTLYKVKDNGNIIKIKEVN